MNGVELEPSFCKQSVEPGGRRLNLVLFLILPLGVTGRIFNFLATQISSSFLRPHLFQRSALTLCGPGEHSLVMYCVELFLDSRYVYLPQCLELRADICQSLFLRVREMMISNSLCGRVRSTFLLLCCVLSSPNCIRESKDLIKLDFSSVSIGPAPVSIALGWDPQSGDVNPYGTQ